MLFLEVPFEELRRSGNDARTPMFSTTADNALAFLLSPGGQPCHSLPVFTNEQTPTLVDITAGDQKESGTGTPTHFSVVVGSELLPTRGVCSPSVPYCIPKLWWQISSHH